uniref:Uncharacterized protein n=1 Tax=Mycena chlorophos TaxID=658473 RepID=A0ABQ0MEC6_MYCCL|nr:predicted protein [Mycena chlorophos]
MLTQYEGPDWSEFAARKCQAGLPSNWHVKRRNIFSSCFLPPRALVAAQPTDAFVPRLAFYPFKLNGNGSQTTSRGIVTAFLHPKSGNDDGLRRLRCRPFAIAEGLFEYLINKQFRLRVSGFHVSLPELGSGFTSSRVYPCNIFHLTYVAQLEASTAVYFFFSLMREQSRISRNHPPPLDWLPLRRAFEPAKF